MHLYTTIGNVSFLCFPVTMNIPITQHQVIFNNILMVANAVKKKKKLELEVQNDIKELHFFQTKQPSRPASIKSETTVQCYTHFSDKETERKERQKRGFQKQPWKDHPATQLHKIITRSGELKIRKWKQKIPRVLADYRAVFPLPYTLFESHEPPCTPEGRPHVGSRHSISARGN